MLCLRCVEADAMLLRLRSPQGRGRGAALRAATVVLGLDEFGFSQRFCNTNRERQKLLVCIEIRSWPLFLAWLWHQET